MTRYKVTDIERSSSFKKNYKKLSAKVKKKFGERFNLWVEDPFGHNFKTERLRSDPRIWKFNVDNDYRVLFEWKKKFSSVSLIGVWDHNELVRKGYY